MGAPHALTEASFSDSCYAQAFHNDKEKERLEPSQAVVKERSSLPLHCADDPSEDQEFPSAEFIRLDVVFSNVCTISISV